MRFLPCVIALLSALPAFADAAAKAAAAATDAPASEATASEASAPAGSAGTFQRIDERSPRPGSPLIANKLYPMQGRLEFSGMFDMTYADKFTKAIGGHGGVAYHLFDWLAFEAWGGYLKGNETSVMGQVRSPDQGRSADPQTQCFGGGTGPCEPQLPDMWQPTWFAGANVQWAPIYGKFSAVSEYDLNFQLFVKAGGGAEGIQKILNDRTFTPMQVRPSGHYGLGLRVIPWKFVALRAELTNFIGLNPNVEEHNTTDETSCTDGYVLPDGPNRGSCQTDLAETSTFQVGLSFIL